MITAHSSNAQEEITTTTVTSASMDPTLQIVVFAVGGGAALIIFLAIVYIIYRRFCRSKKRKKHNRIGIESDIISASDMISADERKNTNTESFHENEIDESDKSTAPLPRPISISLETDSASSKDRGNKFSKIRLIDFNSRMEQMHRDNDYMFRTEFDKMSDRSTMLAADRANSTAAKEENLKKNRFVDVLPYEDTRVTLDGESSYINASFIKGYNRPQEYIATQGPISEEEEKQGKRTATINDFWVMVWQYNCVVIVMLTQCTENFRYKCAQYWPSSVNGTAQYGDITIQLVEEIDRTICIVRKLAVTKNDETRTVTQWHFKEWEDTKAPDPKHLLQFIDMVRMSPAIKLESPTVVHCSAGVGRSGAFIALDFLLQYVRDHDDVDVLSCVRELRSQRIRMVQTQEQYIILYKCLATAVKKKLAEVDRDSKEDGFRSSQFGVASDQQRDHVVNVEVIDVDQQQHDLQQPIAAPPNEQNGDFRPGYRQSINSNDTLDI